MTQDVNHLSKKQLVLSSVRKEMVRLISAEMFCSFCWFYRNEQNFSGNTIFLHYCNLSLNFLGLPLYEIVLFLFLSQNRFFSDKWYSLCFFSLFIYRKSNTISLPYATHKHFVTVFFQLLNILCQGASFCKLSQLPFTFHKLDESNLSTL